MSNTTKKKQIPYVCTWSCTFDRFCIFFANVCYIWGTSAFLSLWVVDFAPGLSWVRFKRHHHNFPPAPPKLPLERLLLISTWIVLHPPESWSWHHMQPRSWSRISKVFLVFTAVMGGNTRSFSLIQPTSHKLWHANEALQLRSNKRKLSMCYPGFTQPFLLLQKYSL